MLCFTRNIGPELKSRFSHTLGPIIVQNAGRIGLCLAATRASSSCDGKSRSFWGGFRDASPSFLPLPEQQEAKKPPSAGV